MARNAADLLVRNESVSDNIRVYSLAVHSESAIVQIVLVAFVVSAVLKPPDPVPTDVREKVDALLANTVRWQGSFDPKALDALGVHGLRALLDRLFPESAAGESHLLSTLIAGRLILQLGDPDFSAREQAESELKALGPGVRSIVVSAVQNPNPEIGVRAGRILRSGNRPFNTSGIESRFLMNFRQYTDAIRDRPRAVVLARRTDAVLRLGLPKELQLHLLRLCIGPVVRTDDDALNEVYRPFVEHTDPEIRKFIVEAIGGAWLNGRSPLLLLDALESPHENVVQAALAYCPNCRDKERAPEVRRRLTIIFNGTNEKLKLQACFPLMHDFQDADAFRHLLELARGGDGRAIAWIGDTCNWGRPAPRDLLDAIVPHLTAKDKELRRATSGALGTYSGEEVVRLLIIMLADEERIIAEEAAENLVSQKHLIPVRKQAGEAAKTHPDRKVRALAAEVLKRLDERK